MPRKGRQRPGHGPPGVVPQQCGRAHDWQPAQWGGSHAEAFTDVEQEFRTGDRIQFTRNNYRADRKNGHTAQVVAVDPQGSSMTVERQDGRREMLDLTHLADRYIRPGWVRTIHSAQGATAERVVAHLESFRPNTVDAPAVYVAISRAKTHAAIYTDSRADLTSVLGIRTGKQIGALDEVWGREKEALIAMPQPAIIAGTAIGG